MCQSFCNGSTYFPLDSIASINIKTDAKPLSAGWWIIWIRAESTLQLVELQGILVNVLILLGGMELD